VKLSKRYFYLEEMLLPKAKIPQLLKNYSSDVHYGCLVKTFSNHINLRIKAVAKENFVLLMPDARHTENVGFLELLKNYVKNDFTAQIYQPKTNKNYQRQVDFLHYDLKLLCYNRCNLMTILEGLKDATVREKRPILRKLKTIGKRIGKLKNELKSLKNKLIKTQIIGFEINHLSDLINQIRTHKTDKKDVRTNMRLLGSLFDLRQEKHRLEDGKEIILVIIGEERSFENI